MAYDDVYGRGGLYRSRNGMIAGVCSRIAEYFDLSVFWIRALAVGVAICTAFWPAVFVYFIAALVMKRNPYIRY